MHFGTTSAIGGLLCGATYVPFRLRISGGIWRSLLTLTGWQPIEAFQSQDWDRDPIPPAQTAIDEVVMFKRPLSHEEIRQEMRRDGLP